MARELPLNPCHQEADDSFLPRGGDGDSARNLPPLCKATAAATGAGVLRLENRMPAHRRLLAVIRRIRGRETVADKVGAVTTDGFDAHAGNVLAVAVGQMEPGAELGFREPGERGIIVVSFCAHDS